MSSKKRNPPTDKSPAVPLTITSLIVLVSGIGGSYLVDLNTPLEKGNDAAAAILAASIIIGGIFAIAAWSKRK